MRCVGETCFIDEEVTIVKRDQMTFFIQIASERNKIKSPPFNLLKF